MQEMGLRGRLDYPAAEIQLNVNSPEEYFVRLRSCAKEPETVEWLEKSARPGDVVFDIGANVGAYSLVAAKCGRGVERVYSFEPGFANYAQLCRNVLLNGCDGRIVPMPIALSDSTGLAEFHISSLNTGAAAQTLQPNGGSEAVDGHAVHTVMTWRLDELIDSLQLPAPNLIKVDVDGAEVRVLEGAFMTLRDPGLRSVLVESGVDSPEKRRVMEILGEAGFTLVGEHRHKAVNYIFSRGGVRGI